MNLPPNIPPDVTTSLHPTPRPLYWCVRREVWENRSIYIAPLVVVSVFLFGFLLSLITLPHRVHAVLLEPAQSYRVLLPFYAVSALLVVTAFIVGVFYCLDAFQSERRDRSILFWKSMPVSDRTTVLSKALVPLAVLPALTVGLAIAAQIVMFVLSSIRLLDDPPARAFFWHRVSVVDTSLAVLYFVLALTLWHAAVYAWLLLVSAWARHAAILWAILPLLPIGMIEGISGGSERMGTSLKFFVGGWFPRAFVHGGGDPDTYPLSALTPGRFLTTPGLWFGLACAAVFLATAIHLRRTRELQ